MKRRSRESPPSNPDLPSDFSEPTSPAGRLRQRLEEANRRYGFLDEVEAVLVATSGGPDSVALLHLLWTLREQLGLRLGVAHLNHRLRGADSEADAEYVTALAQRLDLPLFLEAAQVSAYADEHGLSLETAARRVRYDFLETVARQESWERVALGHTASDRVETVLMNLLRGTGLYGLRGMPAQRGCFIRPLIRAQREETEAYCRHFDLQPRVDATNLDPDYGLRNRVRLKLLPLLREQGGDERFEGNLLRLAEAVESEIEWTEPQVQAVADALLRTTEQGVAVDLAGLRELPAGLRYRLLRRAWTQLTGDPADLHAAGYEALDRLLRESQTGRETHLPGDIRARIGYNEVRFEAGADSGSASPPIKPRVLPTEGEVEVPEIGALLRLERLASRPDELGQARGRQIVVDAEKMALPLHLRSWQPGDVLRPLGMTGHKKVQDLFTDLKVPAAQRGRVPIIVDSKGSIVWVVGCAMSEQAKVGEHTSQFLRLSVEDQAH